MRISKTTWLVLVVGIFIIAAASLSVAYFRRDKEQAQLSEELDVAQTRLNKIQIEPLISQKEALQEQLVDTVSKMEDARDTLAQYMPSIIAGGNLFDIADECGVTIMEMRSSGLSSGNLVDINCALLPFILNIEAEEVDQVIDFVVRLNTDFITGVVKSVELTYPDLNDEDATGEEPITARIEMQIYTYEGD